VGGVAIGRGVHLAQQVDRDPGSATPSPSALVSESNRSGYIPALRRTMALPHLNTEIKRQDAAREPSFRLPVSSTLSAHNRRSAGGCTSCGSPREDCSRHCRASPPFNGHPSPRLASNRPIGVESVLFLEGDRCCTGGRTEPSVLIQSGLLCHVQQLLPDADPGAPRAITGSAAMSKRPFRVSRMARRPVRPSTIRRLGTQRGADPQSHDPKHCQHDARRGRHDVRDGNIERCDIAGDRGDDQCQPDTEPEQIGWPREPVPSKAKHHQPRWVSTTLFA
jgi:hypothetical protein